MPTYERCPKSVDEMAKSLLAEFETHEPTVRAGVSIDFLFAIPDTDDTGKVLRPAISSGGYPALGQCRKINLKDRVAGRADVEILLDSVWWGNATVDEQRALLDHELHHIQPHRKGERDDAGRPKLSIRKHDVQVGWFSIVATRHGKASIEQQDAAKIFDRYGQAFWPDLCEQQGTVTMTAGDKSVTVPVGRFHHLASEMAARK